MTAFSSIQATHFNPRSSCEERLLGASTYVCCGIDFNPRSSCEERLGRPELTDEDTIISIHAPHARNDLRRGCSRREKSFQSTLLMRGATSRPFLGSRPPSTFQSTLLMRGATRQSARNDCQPVPFQSTLLMRGATQGRNICTHGWHISIHAPHARSDLALALILWQLRISIHAPHARSDQNTSCCRPAQDRFQSTLLMRGATSWIIIWAMATHISIHAPHARSDPVTPITLATDDLFQSTLLMRGATSRAERAHRHRGFQSTLLMRGATPFRRVTAVVHEFQSTLLMRGATCGRPCRRVG